MTPRHSGGCQCGAVRYRVDGALSKAHICHCRMCQKAAGNYFMPLADARKSDFEVTRGEIAWFPSSDQARRGFCRDCGTPLIFETIAAAHPNVTIDGLDDPAAVRPVTQDGAERRLSWFKELAALPEVYPDESGRRNNRQYQDHNAPAWPLD